MKLMPTVALEPGTMLAADLFTATGVPLLRSGATITERIRDRLLREEIGRVWVIEPGHKGGTDALTVETRQKATRAVIRTFTASGEALANSGRLTASALDNLSQIVEAIGQDISNAPAAAIALSDLAATDDFTHRHSVNVCIFGLLLAEEHYKTHGWTDREGTVHYGDFEPRLRQLGLGLLLHDIGKVSVPDETLNKPGKLDPEEWAVMKTHAAVGAQLLPVEMIPAPVIAVVRDHHERLDGSGYPTGKTAEHIHEFARIAAISDTFDAITAERPYAAGRPTADAVRIVMECAALGQLDSDLVSSFCRVIAPYPIGTEIELADGRQAIVTEVDMKDPWHPTVQVYAADGTSSEERYVPFTSSVASDPEFGPAPPDPSRAAFPSAAIT